VRFARTHPAGESGTAKNRSAAAESLTAALISFAVVDTCELRHLCRNSPLKFFFPLGIFARRVSCT
jgi:hypothetical protein